MMRFIFLILKRLLIGSWTALNRMKTGLSCPNRFGQRRRAVPGGPRKGAQKNHPDIVRKIKQAHNELLVTVQERLRAVNQIPAQKNSAVRSLLIFFS
jgi:hypothetical protein